MLLYAFFLLKILNRFFIKNKNIKTLNLNNKKNNNNSN